MRQIACIRRAGRLSLVLATLVALTVPVAAMPGLAMLDTLTRGGWTVRIRGAGAQERICLSDGTEFFQLRHRQPGCDRFVVRDTAEEVVVQYTCRGDGYGRTTIRRESPELVQIQSRGIRGGRPFSFSAEARLSGRC